MASLIYNSAIHDVAQGNIVFSSNAFKCMLVQSGYVPDKDAHLKRNQITNEASGTGYTAGGATVTATVAKDTGNDRVTVTFSNPSWATATISANGAVIYRDRGGAATADELAYVDFGSTVSSTAGTFAVTFSTPLTFQNSG